MICKKKPYLSILAISLMASIAPGRGSSSMKKSLDCQILMAFSWSKNTQPYRWLFISSVHWSGVWRHAWAHVSVSTACALQERSVSFQGQLDTVIFIRMRQCWCMDMDLWKTLCRSVSAMLSMNLAPCTEWVEAILMTVITTTNSRRYCGRGQRLVHIFTLKNRNRYVVPALGSLITLYLDPNMWRLNVFMSCFCSFTEYKHFGSYEEPL